MVIIKQNIVSDLSEVFNLLEDLADKEVERMQLYIDTVGLDNPEDDPLVIKSELYVSNLRNKAAKIQDIINLIVDEEELEDEQSSERDI